MAYRSIPRNQFLVIVCLLACSLAFATQRDVASFGAKGDCSTDDTAALVAAATWVNSQTVSTTLAFGPGCYLVDPREGMTAYYLMQITASNVDIYGEGAIIKLKTQSSPYNVLLNVPHGTVYYWNYIGILGSYDKVHGLSFDSNQMATSGPFGSGNGDFWATAVFISGAVRAFVTNDSVYDNNFGVYNASACPVGAPIPDWHSCGLDGWGAIAFYANNVNFSSNIAIGSYGIGCGGFVQGCNIVGNTSSFGLSAHFICNGGGNGGTNSQVQYCNIANNVGNMTNAGSGIDVTACWDCTVSGNTLSGSEDFCIDVNKSGGPYQPEPATYLKSQQVLVTGNTCLNNNGYTGWPFTGEILVGDEYNTLAFRPGDAVQNISIVGNNITTNNRQGVGVAIGYGASDIKISDNYFQGCGGSTVACGYPTYNVERVIDHGAADLTVTNNHDTDQNLYPITWVYLSNAGPYEVSGNGMSTNFGGAALQFVPITPCRLIDTRPQSGGSGPIEGGDFQTFVLPQLARSEGCADLSSAAAYSLNVTVVPSGGLGYLTVWPTGQDQPTVSTLNSVDGRIKANAAIVPAGAGGAVSVFATNETDVILDINGYFAPVTPSTLAFYPLQPCRVVDTRGAQGPLGGPLLQGGIPRDFPLTSSTCNIPASSQAYSLNFTVVPKGPLGYLTAWPAGQNQPGVSTLNAMTGAVTANAAIVRAGNGGDIAVLVSNDSDVVIDINGYFASALPSGLSLYTMAPCRALDTRKTAGLFSGTIAVNVAGSPCGLAAVAQALVLNATVVPQDGLGYLTLWADGQSQPEVSTLNANDGSITSNMAIVPTANGLINTFASNPTQLVLDSSGYFAP
jgi:parallel beta-helix repeat protein